MRRLSLTALIQRIRAQQWLIGVTEQAIVAATSLASLAIMSRQIGLDEVGIVASSLVLWMLVEALQRAIVVLPLTATCPRPETDLETFGSFIALNIVTTAICSVILLVAGILLRPYDEAMGLATMLAAPVSFCGSLFLFLRQAFYLLGRPVLALANAICIALLTLGGLLLMWLAPRADAIVGATVISLGYGISSAAFTIWVASRARFSLGAFRKLFELRRTMMEFATASVALHIATNGAQVLLGVVSGPAAVAVFSFARTLIRPLTLVQHAVVDTERSKMARIIAEQGEQAIAQRVRFMHGTLLVTCTLPLIVILLITEPLLWLLYGENGLAATTTARLWALALVPVVFSSPFEAALTVMRQSRAVAHANGVSMAVMAVVVLAALALEKFDANVAVISVGIAYLAGLVSMYRSYRGAVPSLRLRNATP
jgi:O-antigen/teichoic acid export membrane protein